MACKCNDDERFSHRGQRKRRSHCDLLDETENMRKYLLDTSIRALIYQNYYEVGFHNQATFTQRYRTHIQMLHESCTMKVDLTKV